MSTGRKPMRSPIAPAGGDSSAPARAAPPATRPMPLARPGPRPATSSTTTGMYGRDIWLARNDEPEDHEDRPHGRVAEDGLDRPERERQDPTLRNDLGPLLGGPEGHEGDGHERQRRRQSEDAARPTSRDHRSGSRPAPGRPRSRPGRTPRRRR